MRALILAGGLALLACGAKADPETSATLTVERHATSNALDGPYAFFDWYAVLRGGLDAQVSRRFRLGRPQDREPHP